MRARQQETLARLGERALTESDLQKFFNEVVTTVGDILDVEMVKSSNCAGRCGNHAPGRNRMESGNGGLRPYIDRPRFASWLHAGFRPSRDLEDLQPRQDFPACCCCMIRGRKRDHDADRRAGRPCLRRDLCPHDKAAEIPGLRHLIPGRCLQRGGRRHPSPANRSAPRTDDPRIASSFRKPILKAAGLVLETPRIPAMFPIS